MSPCILLNKTDDSNVTLIKVGITINVNPPPPPPPPDLEWDYDELDDCVDEDAFSSDGEEVDESSGI